METIFGDTAPPALLCVPSRIIRSGYAAMFGFQILFLCATHEVAEAADVQCVPRPPSIAAPPATIPSASIVGADRARPALSKDMPPACPDGQIPALPGQPNTARGTSQPKGNPLLRPQTFNRLQTGFPTEKFLPFNKIYSGKPTIQQRKAPSCVVYQNTCYYYAAAGDSTSAGGAGMTLSIDRPAYLNPNATGHTLNEIAVQGGTGNGDIVELGWIVSTDQNGDPDPHIFVFHWVGGNEGCYDGCGWQQFSSKYYPGQDVSPLTGQDIYAGYVFYQGNWWAWFDREWLGYFPGTEWKNGYVQSSLIQWFGEVATTRTDPPSIQMGDGIFPPPPTAAHMLDLCEVDSNLWKCSISDKQTLAPPTVATLYNITKVDAGDLRYGGPGH